MIALFMLTACTKEDPDAKTFTEDEFKITLNNGFEKGLEDIDWEKNFSNIGYDSAQAFQDGLQEKFNQINPEDYLKASREALIKVQGNTGNLITSTLKRRSYRK